MSIDISREIILECQGKVYHAHYRHIDDELNLVTGYSHVTTTLPPCHRERADAAARKVLLKLIAQGRAWHHRN